MNSTFTTFKDIESMFRNEMQTIKQYQAEQDELFKGLDPEYGRENYEFIVPIIKAIRAAGKRYMSWQVEGVGTLTIEDEEKGSVFTQDCSLIVDFPFFGDAIKSPWVNFRIDDTRKTIIPTYVQDDVLMLYKHVCEGNEINRDNLRLADMMLYRGTGLMEQFSLTAKNGQLR